MASPFHVLLRGLAVEYERVQERRDALAFENERLRHQLRTRVPAKQPRSPLLLTGFSSPAESSLGAMGSASSTLRSREVCVKSPPFSPIASATIGVTVKSDITIHEEIRQFDKIRQKWLKLTQPEAVRQIEEARQAHEEPSQPKESRRQRGGLVQPQEVRHDEEVRRRWEEPSQPEEARHGEDDRQKGEALSQPEELPGVEVKDVGGEAKGAADVDVRTINGAGLAAPAEGARVAVASEHSTGINGVRTHIRSELAASAEEARTATANHDSTDSNGVRTATGAKLTASADEARTPSPNESSTGINDERPPIRNEPATSAEEARTATANDDSMERNGVMTAIGEGLTASADESRATDANGTSTETSDVMATTGCEHTASADESRATTANESSTAVNADTTPIGTEPATSADETGAATTGGNSTELSLPVITATPHSVVSFQEDCSGSPKESRLGASDKDKRNPALLAVHFRTNDSVIEAEEDAGAGRVEYNQIQVVKDKREGEEEEDDEDEEERLLKQIKVERLQNLAAQEAAEKAEDSTVKAETDAGACAGGAEDSVGKADVEAETNGKKTTESGAKALKEADTSAQHEEEPKVPWWDRKATSLVAFAAPPTPSTSSSAFFPSEETDEPPTMVFAPEERVHAKAGESAGAAPALAKKPPVSGAPLAPVPETETLVGISDDAGQASAAKGADGVNTNEIPAEAKAKLAPLPLFRRAEPEDTALTENGDATPTSLAPTPNSLAPSPCDFGLDSTTSSTNDSQCPASVDPNNPESHEDRVRRWQLRKQQRKQKKASDSYGNMARRSIMATNHKTETLVDFLENRGLLFTDLEMLGKGTYARVYKGTWHKHGMENFAEPLPVALKCIRGIQSVSFVSQGGTQRKPRWLDREVSVSQVQDHKNLLKFFKISVEELPYVFVMEYCQGGSLYSKLHNQPGVLALMDPQAAPMEIVRPNLRILNWRQRMKIAIDVAEGMQYLHAINVIHRDLKSQNVLLRERVTPANMEPHAKVGDFGLARYKEDAASASGPCVSVDVGSWIYMAPEVFSDIAAEEPQRYTEKADVYSYAMMIYELLADRLPFEDMEEFRHATGHQIGLQVCGNKTRPDVSNIPSNAPESLRVMMTRTWQAAPHERPSFTQVVEDLQQVYESYQDPGPAQPPCDEIGA